MISDDKNQPNEDDLDFENLEIDDEFSDELDSDLLSEDLTDDLAGDMIDDLEDYETVDAFDTDTSEFDEAQNIESVADFPDENFSDDNLSDVPLSDDHQHSMDADHYTEQNDPMMDPGLENNNEQAYEHEPALDDIENDADFYEDEENSWEEGEAVMATPGADADLQSDQNSSNTQNDKKKGKISNGVIAVVTVIIAGILYAIFGIQDTPPKRPPSPTPAPATQQAINPQQQKVATTNQTAQEQKPVGFLKNPDLLPGQSREITLEKTQITEETQATSRIGVGLPQPEPVQNNAQNASKNTAPPPVNTPTPVSTPIAPTPAPVLPNAQPAPKVEPIQVDREVMAQKTKTESAMAKETMADKILPPTSTTDITTLQNDIGQLKNRSDAMQVQMETIVSQLDGISKTLGQNGHKGESLANIIQPKSNELAELKQSITRIEGKITTLEGRFETLSKNQISSKGAPKDAMAKPKTTIKETPIAVSPKKSAKKSASKIAKATTKKTKPPKPILNPPTPGIKPSLPSQFAKSGSDLDKVVERIGADRLAGTNLENRHRNRTGRDYVRGTRYEHRSSNTRSQTRFPIDRQPMERSQQAPTSLAARPIPKSVISAPSLSDGSNAPKWALRAVQPGRAWISPLDPQTGSQDTEGLREITVGDRIQGLGEIISIRQQLGGRWVVRGTLASLEQ